MKKFFAIADMVINYRRTTGTQFFKFGIVGVSNTIVHYLTFIILLKLVGIHLILASTIGYLFGVINSFLLNRTWTFQVKGALKKSEALKFFVVNAVSLCINLLLLEILVKNLSLRPEFSQILAIFGSLIINFWGNKIWTFRPNQSKINEKF